MKIFSFFAATVVWLVSAVSFAAVINADIEKWVSVPQPKMGTDAWHSSNLSTYEWKVYLDKGGVRAAVYDPKQNITGDKPDFEIVESKEMKGNKYTLKVADGWLIGFNAGEFGGGLWWFSNTGKEKYMISGDLIRGFIEKDGNIYAIEGLAHITYSSGNVVKIIKNRKTGKYESITYSLLGEAPYAAALDSYNSIIVVTSSSLFSITPEGKAVKLLDGAFWGGLYPNSIVIDSNRNAYIGMRQGVAKVSLTKPTPTVEWLVPSKSFLKEESESYKQRRP